MLHEERSALSSQTLDMKRAIDSFREELEAVDWYKQRAEACTDKNLQQILLHNMREEQEHAAMLLSWICHTDTNMEEQVKTYLARPIGEIVKKED